MYVKSSRRASLLEEGDGDVRGVRCQEENYPNLSPMVFRITSKCGVFLIREVANFLGHTIGNPSK